MLKGSEALGELVFRDDLTSLDRRIRSLELPVGRFRIPPRELAEMLPQQSLMLRVAGEASATPRGTQACHRGPVS